MNGGLDESDTWLHVCHVTAQSTVIQLGPSGFLTQAVSMSYWSCEIVRAIKSERSNQNCGVKVAEHEPHT